MSFSPPPGLSRRSVPHGNCTHMQVTRLYDPKALCDLCGEPGSCGWVYHCTQDVEDLVEHVVIKEELEFFDDLADQLCSQLRVRACSPLAREDKLSFLTELSKEELAQYQPNQIATILRQREEVQIAAQRDTFEQNGKAILKRAHGYMGFRNNGHIDKKPWVCELDQQCRYQVCSQCRPTISDRAFLSLDGVLEGDIPPTAAVGWGFHVEGERPVADAEIVRNIGHQRLPMVRARFTRKSRHTLNSQFLTGHIPGEGSFDSDLNADELLNQHLAKEARRWTGNSLDTEHSEIALTSWPLLQPGNDSNLRGELKHSPGFADLKTLTESRMTSDSTPCLSRLPSSPDSSVQDVNSWTRSRSVCQDNALETALNQSPRVEMHTSAAQYCEIAEVLLHDQSQEALRLSSHPQGVTSNAQGDIQQKHVDPATGLRLKRKHEHDESRTPDGSPPSTPLWKPRSTVLPSLVELCAEGAHDGRFSPSPLKLNQGIAVMEESVELGVPDIVTQV